MDSADDDLGKFLHMDDVFCQFPCQGCHGFRGKVRFLAVRFHVADVAACAEGASCTFHDNDLHFFVLVSFGERIFEFQCHREIDCVQRLLVVECNRFNAVFDFCLILV